MVPQKFISVSLSVCLSVCVCVCLSIVGCHCKVPPHPQIEQQNIRNPFHGAATQ